MSKQKPLKPEEPKPWEITLDDMKSITEKEFLYGTDRCMPPVEIIPKEFFAGTNMYCRMTDAMYIGAPVPNGEVHTLPGFEEAIPHLVRFLMAHLKSIQADYDHKMAGVAFMMSKIVRIVAILT